MPYRPPGGAPERSGRVSEAASNERPIVCWLTTWRRYTSTPRHRRGGEIATPVPMNNNRTPQGSETMLSKKLRPACVAAGLALSALAYVMPATADAGTFTIHSCKLPDGSPAATDGWTPDSHSPFLPQVDDCSQGVGLRTQMQGVGISDGVERAWTWTAA